MLMPARRILGIATLLLISAAAAPPAYQNGRQRGPRPPYGLPRNREINVFNEVGTRIWYAHMLVNPVYGTRSAYYGSDPDTVAHQLSPSAVQRYELKSTERILIRLFDENPALIDPSERRGREFLLQSGKNYRLVRRDDGSVGVWLIADAGTVEIRNGVSEDLSYDLIHLDSQGQEHRLTIDIAPRGTNYHNVRGTVECLPGLQSQRTNNGQATTTITADRSYVLRLDPAGRLTSPQGNWDLFDDAPEEMP